MPPLFMDFYLFFWYNIVEGGFMEKRSMKRMKEELKQFETEQNELLDRVNLEINSPESTEERVSSYMASILYEHRRLETCAKLRATSIDPQCQTEEGRANLLMRMIEKSFNKEQGKEIVQALREAGCTEVPHDAKSIAQIMPIIEKLAMPTLEKIDSFKSELQDLYLKHDVPFMHVSPVDIQDGHINPSRNLENQPKNEMMTGVFATSSYEEINRYIARAISGGMICTRDYVQYPKNPFLPVSEQTNPNMIQLAKPVYAYALDANGFEPQVHFEPTKQGFCITFNDEWVKRTEEPLKFHFQEEINAVDSAPFLQIDTKYKDVENQRIVSYRDMFAKKFDIKIIKDEEHEKNGQEP